MQTLKEYILNKELPQEFDEDLNVFWNIKDINTWLFETYDKSLNVSEDEFYNSKYLSNYVDLPKYWYWQRKLYETLSHSLKIHDEIEYDNKYAYYVTTNFDYEKINKNGLIPKSKLAIRTYDKPIYLWLSKDKIDINDAVILRINLKEFEKDHRKRMKLFGDPQTSNNAVYTFEPIPTKYIEKIEL